MLPSSVKPAGHTLLWPALYVSAFVSSLFFNGTAFVYFSVTYVLLCLLALAVVWHGHATGLSLPRSPLALALGAFSAWLALSLLWTQVPHASLVALCEIGSLSLVFLLVTLARDPDEVWRWTSRALLLAGLILALHGLYQLLAHGSDARSVFPSRTTHAALLMLVAIPAAGQYLICSLQNRRSGQWLLTAALFLLFLGIAVTGSRGVTLSLLLGTGLIVLLSLRHVPARRVWWPPALLAAAYLTALWIEQEWLTERLGSLLDPRVSGRDRLLIWSGAWDMVAAHPWLGIGLGTFWLAWPPYRHPQDSSSGYFAHNDYLQIWIETGLPGVLLLVSIYAAVAFLLVRSWKSGARDATAKVETAGLAGAVLALAFHSFFDFDLYILPILLVVGLILGRFHWLALPAAPTRSGVWQPGRWLSAGGYCAIALGLVLLPILYFTAVGYSAYAYDKARRHAAKGEWGEATSMLRHAWRAMPADDTPLIVHADVLRIILSALPRDSLESRRLLYAEILTLLERAERANPLRPLIFFLRGQLLRDNPDLAGGDWANKAAAAYEAALRLDPRAYRVRTAYAQMLLGLGRPAQARRVLEGGVEYWYYPEADLLAYYALAIELRRQTGDQSGAAALERLAQRQRAIAEKESPGATASARPGLPARPGAGPRGPRP